MDQAIFGFALRAPTLDHGFRSKPSSVSEGLLSCIREETVHFFSGKPNSKAVHGLERLPELNDGEQFELMEFPKHPKCSVTSKPGSLSMLPRPPIIDQNSGADPRSLDDGFRLAPIPFPLALPSGTENIHR